MDAHTWTGRVLGAVAAAMLLGACTTGGAAITAGATALPTPAVTAGAVATLRIAPTARPAPTPTVAPTAAIYGPVSVVSGIQMCVVAFGPLTGGGTSEQHSRDGAANCTDTTNDPRVNGQALGDWNVDYWGTPDRMRGALVQWGTLRLTNADGTWEGRARGVYSADRGDSIVIWWTGTGAYAGLAYFELITGSGPWTIQGQIFPGSPPKP